MAQYDALQEEELKLRIAEAFFAQYDCNTRLGKIDFCAVQKQNNAIFAIDLKNVPTAHFVGGVLQKSADNFHFRRGCCGNEAFAEILRLNKVKQQICETKLP